MAQSFRNRTRGILLSTELKASQKCIALWLMLKADEERAGGQCTATTTELQRCASTGRDGVFAATKRLEQTGWIERREPEERNGRRGQYRILTDRVVRAVVDAFEEHKVAKRSENPTGLGQIDQSAAPTAPFDQPVGKADRCQSGMSTGRENRPENPTGSKESFPHTPFKENTPKGEVYIPSARAHARDEPDPAPHMNGVGFVISAKHGLIIPTAKVAEWRERFPNIPCLEAAMSSLALNLRKQGRMHKGWDCPEGWMVKPLADMNLEASLKKSAAGASGGAKARSTRALIDAA